MKYSPLEIAMIELTDEDLLEAYEQLRKWRNIPEKDVPNRCILKRTLRRYEFLTNSKQSFGFIKQEIMMEIASRLYKEKYTVN